MVETSHLKNFITLCVHQQAFAASREEEEIQALWRAAHQKVLLDELWLQRLLSQQAPSGTSAGRADSWRGPARHSSGFG